MEMAMELVQLISTGMIIRTIRIDRSALKVTLGIMIHTNHMTMVAIATHMTVTTVVRHTTMAVVMDLHMVVHMVRHMITIVFNKSPEGGFLLQGKKFRVYCEHV